MREGLDQTTIIRFRVIVRIHVECATHPQEGDTTHMIPRNHSLVAQVYKDTTGVTIPLKE